MLTAYVSSHVASGCPLRLAGREGRGAVKGRNAVESLGQVQEDVGPLSAMPGR